MKIVILSLIASLAGVAILSIPVGSQQPAPIINCNVTDSKPNPSINKFFNASHPCVIAKFASYFDLGDGNYIDLSKSNLTSYDCALPASNQTSQKLVIDFGCGSLMLSINKLQSNVSTVVSNIQGEFWVNNTKRTVHSIEDRFPTKSGYYFECNAEQIIHFDGQSSPNVTLVLSHFAYEAFRQTNSTDFVQLPEQCPQDSQPASDLVRIAVGLCLVVLVAIVLIAYCVGRRMWSKRSSYESV